MFGAVAQMAEASDLGSLQCGFDSRRPHLIFARTGARRAMPSRKRAGNGRGSPADVPTLADLRDTLWRAADKLRGCMDATQYKDFVLGLVFLKYVSDGF